MIWSKVAVSDLLPGRRRICPPLQVVQNVILRAKWTNDADGQQLSLLLRLVDCERAPPTNPDTRSGFMQYNWSGMEILATSVAVHIRTAFMTTAVNTVLASKYFSTRNPPYVQIVSSVTIQGIYVARGRCEHFIYNTNSSCRLRISIFIIGSASRKTPVLRTLGCCPCGSLQSYLSKI